MADAVAARSRRGPASSSSPAANAIAAAGNARRDTSRPRKVVETVSTEGTWCCIARSSLPSSPTTPSRLKSKELRKLCAEDDESERNGKPTGKENRSSSRNADPAIITANPNSADDAIASKSEKKRRSGELHKAGEVLKNGEIAALIKQGFIGGVPLERGNGSPFKIRLSPGRVSPLIDTSSSPVHVVSAPSYAKLNTILTSGFLSQSSPPIEKTRSSPTLFEMMVNEQEMQDKVLLNAPHLSSQQAHGNSKQLSLQERIMSASSPGSQFNDPFSSDLRLILSNREGFSVTLNLHVQILAVHSRFFAAKLSERWSKPQSQGPHLVEISDCEDVEMYVETLRLMYCRDLKRKLLKETVARVLSILKISAAIVFEAGVLSCLEFLEAVPWAEEDEDKVASLLSQLQLRSIGAGEVLQRLSTEDPGASQDILVRLVHLVTRGTDEKARREMKSLVSRMLRENAAQGKDPADLSKESLYQSCHVCLESLLHLFAQASSADFISRPNDERGLLATQITRQADNLNWLVDILIDRHIADDFVRIWAFQSELAALHAQIPIAYGRYEVSRLTARLCVAVGKGQVLAPKEIRFTLLHNWLQPLIDDFGWMQRACKGLDRKVVEEGISQTILTLPLKQQQTIMIAWFDRFLKSGDDCPNLHRAFEIWWRRTFVRPQIETLTSPDQPLVQQASSADIS